MVKQFLGLDAKGNTVWGDIEGEETKTKDVKEAEKALIKMRKTHNVNPKPSKDTETDVSK